MRTCTCLSNSDLHSPTCAIRRSVRATWKKGPRRSGRMRLPNTYQLTIGGERVATAQQHSDGGWFWYGRKDGQVFNTAGLSRPIDEVKLEAVAVMRPSTQP